MFSWPLAALLLGLPSNEVFVASSSVACPTSTAVAVNLSHLMPEQTFRAAPEGRSARIRIDDRGPLCRITADEQHKDLADPGRDCAARARAAAVFAALILERSPEPAPPLPLPTPPPPIPTTSVAAPLGPRLVGVERSGFGIDVSGALHLAWVGPHFAPGASARGWWMGQRLGGFVGVSLLGPIDLDFNGIQARVLRIPMELGARARWSHGPLQLDLDLGAVAGWLQIRGLSPSAQERSLRLELGVRAGALLRWASGPLSPFLLIDGVWVPSPYGIALQRVGVVGYTPGSWLSVGLGLTLKFD